MSAHFLLGLTNNILANYTCATTSFRMKKFSYYDLQNFSLILGKDLNWFDFTFGEIFFTIRKNNVPRRKSGRYHSDSENTSCHLADIS